MCSGDEIIQYKIRLKPEEIQGFVREADRCEFDVDIAYNSLVVDAKSILGVDGLDFSQVLTVYCQGYDEAFEECLKKYMVQGQG